MKTLLNKILPNLTKDQINNLASKIQDTKTQTLSKGDTLYTQGKPVHALHVLTSGLVRVYDIEPHHEVNLRFLCDNAVVIPMYALTQTWGIGNSQTTTIATDTAQCITDCTVISLPLANLETLSEWGDKIKLELALRHYRSMEERLKMLQLKTALERYLTFVTTMPSAIINGMPSHHIASYLSISPETLSRTRKAYHADN